MILDLTKFYRENKNVEWAKLRIKKTSIIRKVFCGPIFLDKKKFAMYGKQSKKYVGYYKCGKHSIFLFPYEGNLCYKFFIFYTKATRGEVEQIHKIHNKLAEKRLAPKSYRICEVDVIVPDYIIDKKNSEYYPRVILSRINPSGIGYGIVLEKTDPISYSGEEKKRIDKKVISRMKKICKKYKIYRRGTVNNLLVECNDEGNKIYTKDGFVLIDIDNRCTIN